MNKEVSNEETQEDTQTQHSLHEGINTEKTLVPARRWKKATVAEEEEVKKSGSRWAWRGRERQAEATSFIALEAMISLDIVLKAMSFMQESDMLRLFLKGHSGYW